VVIFKEILPNWYLIALVVSCQEFSSFKPVTQNMRAEVILPVKTRDCIVGSPSLAALDRR
jgi:hypothetical protein